MEKARWQEWLVIVVAEDEDLWSHLGRWGMRENGIQIPSGVSPLSLLIHLQSSLEILLSGTPKDQQVFPNLFMSYWDSIRDGEWGPSVSKAQKLSFQQLSSIFPFLPRPGEIFFYLMGWVSPEFSLCIPSNHFTSSLILSRKFWKTNPRSSDSQNILVLTRIITRNTW